jgi:hypothetical protein
MRLNLLSDINWESKIDHAIKVVDTASLANMHYGQGLSALGNEMDASLLMLATLVRQAGRK